MVYSIELLLEGKAAYLIAVLSVVHVHKPEVAAQRLADVRAQVVSNHVLNVEADVGVLFDLGHDLPFDAGTLPFDHSQSCEVKSLM